MKQKQLDRIIKEYREDLFKFFLSIVKNPEVAEDMTHDVLLSLTRKYQKSPDIHNLKSYLHLSQKPHHQLLEKCCGFSPTPGAILE